jgi:hypothetical protein
VGGGVGQAIGMVIELELPAGVPMPAVVQQHLYDAGDICGSGGRDGAVQRERGEEGLPRCGVRPLQPYAREHVDLKQHERDDGERGACDVSKSRQRGDLTPRAHLTACYQP